MKFLVILITLSFILTGCFLSEKTQKKEAIVLDSSIVNFVEEFIKFNHCGKCLNDITIDKILPDSTIITIRSQASYKRYFQENSFRQIAEIGNSYFFIYTGDERFRRDLVYDTTEFAVSGDNCSLVTWTIINTKGRNKFLKYGGDPFLYPDFNVPRSKVDFVIPNAMSFS